MSISDIASLTAFDGTKTAFGRHETFGVRYGWLPKGFQAIKDNPKAFESDDSIVVLGVGRNMVKSIRFWLRAARIAEPTSVGFEPTKIGEAIFSEQGWDPYLEDEGTIWLLHWLMATNPSQATAWYWFFNRFHKPEFTGQEVATALHDFVKEHTSSQTTVSTLKADASVLLRMYAQSKGLGRMPLEEALDSPLSLLRLITQMSGGKRYISRSESRDALPLGILGFAISEVFLGRSTTQMPIEDLMYGRSDYPAVGAVFRLTENALLAKLEHLVHYMPGSYELRESAGIHQMYKLEDVEPQKYLALHYGAGREEVAA